MPALVKLSRYFIFRKKWVQHLGTSRTIPRKQYSAKTVALELNALLENPSYAAKAIEIGKIIQAEDGVNVACDAIEKQLAVVWMTQMVTCPVK